MLLRENRRKAARRVCFFCPAPVFFRSTRLCMTRCRIIADFEAVVLWLLAKSKHFAVSRGWCPKKKKEHCSCSLERDKFSQNSHAKLEFDRTSTIYDILRQLAWLALHSNRDRRAFPFFYFYGACRLMHFLSSRHSLKLKSCCISKLFFLC